MSLLDDAKAFLPSEDGDPLRVRAVTGGEVCVMCGYPEPAHKRICPVLSLPKIIAVLEAAETLVGEWVGGAEPQYQMGQFVMCNGTSDHADDCPWLALVVALAPSACGT